jgi:selenocysteine lyase/cysteine desulfurase
MDNILRYHFPVTEKAIYLNHAAIGPSPKLVYKETQRGVYNKLYGDMYFAPLDVMYDDLDNKREIIGKLIHSRDPADEIAFTYNTSYGLAAIAEAIDWNEGDTVILNDLEYTSNSYTYQALARKNRLNLEVIQNKNGILSLEQFQQALDASTRLVAVSHVQFSNGFRLDLEALTKLVHEVGGQIIVDGIQSLGVIPLDVQTTNIDYLASGGYKWLLSPLGTGFMYVRKDLTDDLNPTFIGSMSDAKPMDLSHHDYTPGPAARRFQASLSPGAHLLSVAVNFLLDIDIQKIFKHVIKLTDIIIQFVEDQQSFELNSPVDRLQCRSGIINFKCPNSKDVVIKLRKLRKPIAVSHREGGIRISPHCYNTEEEIQTCMETIAKLSHQ